MGVPLLEALRDWCRCRWTGLSSVCWQGDDILLEGPVDHGSDKDYRDRSPVILLRAPKQIDSDILDTPVNLIRFIAEKQQRIMQTPETTRKVSREKFHLARDAKCVEFVTIFRNPRFPRPDMCILSAPRELLPATRPGRALCVSAGPSCRRCAGSPRNARLRPRPPPCRAAQPFLLFTLHSRLSSSSLFRPPAPRRQIESHGTCDSCR